MRLLLVFALIAVVTADETLIAYRVISSKLAAAYQKAGTIVMDPDSPSSDQLGPGVYTSPIAGDWFPTQGKYVCALYADTSKWNLVNKAWVPEKVTPNFETPTGDDQGCIASWWMGTAPQFARSRYLTQVGGSGFTTDNTVLLSQVDLKPQPNSKLQMLIPEALVGTSNPLGIRVECVQFQQSAGNNGADSFASINKGPIDWSSWLNVKGVVQTPEPEN